MRAVFVADGPDFVDGLRMRKFDNVDVYPLLARLLRVKAAPNDGDDRTFDAALEGPALAHAAGTAALEHAAPKPPR